MGRSALDTNILVYAQDVQRGADDERKIEVARRLIGALVAGPHAPVLSVHVLAELWNVLSRKGRWTEARVRAAVDRTKAVGEFVQSTPALLDQALDLAKAHKLQIFDALIIAAAAAAGFSLLVSEDLQDGFSWCGLTVTNPFGPAPAPTVAALLAA